MTLETRNFGGRIFQKHPARYSIISGSTAYDLEDKVRKLIRGGWKPQGGVSIHKSTMVQAMTTEEWWKGIGPAEKQ